MNQEHSASRGFKIPEGFKIIMWSEVVREQEVYLIGVRDGWPHAYGPHWVYNPDLKTLRNSVKKIFPHLQEDLLIKENQDVQN